MEEKTTKYKVEIEADASKLQKILDNLHEEAKSLKETLNEINDMIKMFEGMKISIERRG